MRAREGGAISIAVIAGALILMLASLGAADVGSLLIARARAQAAADAAALAAAARLAPILRQDGAPADAAEQTARANGADLLECACARGDTQAAVVVRRRARATLVRAWDGLQVRASAVAELDADVYSYRDGG